MSTIFIILSFLLDLVSDIFAFTTQNFDLAVQHDT